MGSPAGLSLSSCSRRVRGRDTRRKNVMSDVCLPPVYTEASGIHHHYHPAGWHIQILLHVIHPLHEREEKKERVDEKKVQCKTGVNRKYQLVMLCFALVETPYFSFLLPFLLLFFKIFSAVSFVTVSLSFSCLSLSSSFLCSLLPCVIFLYVVFSFHRAVTFSSPSLSSLSLSLCGWYECEVSQPINTNDMLCLSHQRQEKSSHTISLSPPTRYHFPPSVLIHLFLSFSLSFFSLSLQF